MTGVTRIRGGVIVDQGRAITDHEIVVDGDRIVEVREARSAVERDAVIDVSGLTIAPGFIDIHVHGGLGHDTLDATPEAIRAMSAQLARHGVTTFVPSTVTASRQDISDAIAVVADLGHDVPGARPRGIHLEGPYVARAQAGAQPLEWLRNPDPEEYLPWFDSGAVSRITVAPELPGAQELIVAAVNRGVAASIGHTACSSEDARTAIETGARQATHIFSGMEPLNHRRPGALSAILGDARVYTEAIVDGVHIHPEMVALLLAIVGDDRLVLVSDAMRAAGMPDGEYSLGDQTVRVEDGVTRRADGGLAGSLLTLDVAVRNIMAFTGRSLPAAVRFATENPARAMGWNHEIGSVAKNHSADLVVLDPANNVVMTLVAGRVVFDARQETRSGPTVVRRPA